MKLKEIKKLDEKKYTDGDFPFLENPTAREVIAFIGHQGIVLRGIFFPIEPDRVFWWDANHGIHLSATRLTQRMGLLNPEADIWKDCYRMFLYHKGARDWPEYGHDEATHIGDYRIVIRHFITQASGGYITAEQACALNEPLAMMISGFMRIAKTQQELNQAEDEKLLNDLNS